MRYLTVLDTLNLKSIYQVRCMTTGYVYYVRAKYFAKHYKKFDVIRIDNSVNNCYSLSEDIYEQE